jgi:excisionase family DNA binding protein
MSVSESQSGSEVRREEVLTLAEAAAYLRVSEEELAGLADRDGVPSRKVGGEWRFLKKALDDWLRFPGRYPRDYWKFSPHWLLESPFADELLYLLEERLLQRLKQAAPAAPRPGSKQAFLRHFGIFCEDTDLEERLADALRRREAGG